MEEFPLYIKRNKTRFRRHPYFNFIYTTIKNGRIVILDTRTNKYECGDILACILNIDPMTTDFAQISDEHYFDVRTGEINGVKYEMGSELSSYPKFSEIKHYHPLYKDCYVNFFGNPYKDGNEIPIIKDVIKFKSDFGFIDERASRFAYECFNGFIVSLEFKIERIRRMERYSLCSRNLRRKTNKDFDETKTKIISNVLRHPSFHQYGLLNGEAYSFITKSTIRHGKLITIYNSKTKNKFMYNWNRFKYECEKQTPLNKSDFLIEKGNELIPVTEGSSFEFNEELFRPTKHPYVYLGDKGNAFYTPWERVVPSVRTSTSFDIVIGSKDKPKLLSIPL